ncbi:MAG: PD-(D/E)XK nuclease family protein, partial [Myxococcota bacterium]|nr:PD-(D/E)XK nuclease family protein [Myxococcota bacterium]
SLGDVKSAGKLVPQAIASDIARLLGSGAVIEPWAGSSAEPRPVGAGDVAVLCRTKDWGKRVSEALSALRIPSVLQVDASVFETAEAAHFQALLDILADPSDARALRVFLATPLIDLKAEDFLALRDGPEAWERWLVEARAWQACLQRSGVIAGFQKILNDHGGQQRLLSWRDGERRLTNYLHLAELVHQASKSGGLGPRALHAWLERMRIDATAREEEGSDDALVRLESDANAVQILTIHRSKGLQYPVVYCPDLWSGMILGKEDPGRPRFHDPDDDHRLKLDMGTAARDSAVNQMRWERLAENRRMLYVALTRAEHRLVVVWGGFKDAGSSALGLLLHPPPGVDEFEANRSDELEKSSRKELKSRPDADLRADLEALAARVPGAISVEPLSLGGATGEALAPGPAPELSPRVAARKISSRWRVSSFSGLVASATARGQGRSDNHPASQGLDYDDPGAAPSEPAAEPAEPRVLLHAFPAGTGPGTMIHAVFERIDFALADPEQLPAEVGRALDRHGLAEDLGPKLCEGIRQVVATPLGGPLEAFSLAELERADRVDEMEFTLPVLHSSGRPLTPSDLAQAFETHGKAPAVREYAERLGALDFPPLEGHLRGFIDLTFRHQGRFYLADYKSNQLGHYPAHYGPDELANQMRRHDYVLQYHLYTVALHRHLARRLPGYDYDTHMGGAYYLFLRGMSPDRPGGGGIFHDRPPRELIEALSASLGDEPLQGEAP